MWTKCLFSPSQVAATGILSDKLMGSICLFMMRFEMQMSRYLTLTIQQVLKRDEKEYINHFNHVHLLTHNRVTTGSRRCHVRTRCRWLGWSNWPCSPIGCRGPWRHRWIWWRHRWRHDDWSGGYLALLLTGPRSSRDLARTRPLPLALRLSGNVFLEINGREKKH